MTSCVGAYWCFNKNEISLIRYLNDKTFRLESFKTYCVECSRVNKVSMVFNGFQWFSIATRNIL